MASENEKQGWQIKMTASEMMGFGNPDPQWQFNPTVTDRADAFANWNAMMLRGTATGGLLGSAPVEPVKAKNLPDMVAIPISVEETGVKEEEYAALAKKVGWAVPTAINTLKLRRFFQREEIPVYPLDQVEQHMSAITPSRLQWFWRPLRGEKVDGKPLRASLVSGAETPYNKPIPIEALRLVERVQKEFKDAEFLVTDYAQRKPDPFLAVRYCGELFVVMHWDEPKFKL